MGDLYIGTSGYVYKDWRGLFYPKGVAQKNWLTYYAERFNSVEINATFYGHFKQSVFEAWYAKTPPDFRFTLKGPKPITHVKRLEDVKGDLDYFLKEAVALREKLSLLLWQLPPSFRNEPETFERLGQFLTLLPTTIRQVVEVRHKSWFTDDVFEMLDHYGVGWVINDSTRWAQHDTITGDVMYVRFHGPDRLYASEYTTEQLTAWANRIGPELDRRDVYIYFNNDYGGRALRNAAELRAILTGTTVEVMTADVPKG